MAALAVPTMRKPASFRVIRPRHPYLAETRGPIFKKVKHRIYPFTIADPANTEGNSEQTRFLLNTIVHPHSV